MIVPFVDIDDNE